MRAGSSHKLDSISGSQPEAKSLFRNILTISPCGSRFYPCPALSNASKSLEINILDDRRKIRRVEPLAKSLFHNILAVSYCGSRFYEDLALSPVSKF